MYDEMLAEIESEKLLSGKNLEIYRFLVKQGGSTSGELFINLEAFNKGAISARLSDLQNFGCVEKVGRKVCPITKKWSAIFDVNGKRPERQKKKPKLDLKDWNTRAQIVLRGFLDRVAEPEKLTGSDRWYFESAKELLVEAGEPWEARRAQDTL